MYLKKIQYDSALIKFPEMDVKMPPYTSVMLTPYNMQYSTYFPPPFFWREGRGKGEIH